MTNAPRLLIIGGAERRGTAILARFVALAGGAAADIVVIATASRDPALLETEYVSAFAGLGAGRVRALRVTTRAEAAAASLGTATGVFFTGGDQQRITSTLGGTALDTQLLARVADRSLVVAGTSAGAAMMSGTMIIGGDGPGVTTSAVRTGPGLELLPGVLIDMHFAERGRLNRLLSAVAMYPHELGLGIDEDTAILADGDRFEVLGSGSVTVVDAGCAADIRVPADGPIAIAGARIHVLPAGYGFHLQDRCPGWSPAGPSGSLASGSLSSGSLPSGSLPSGSLPGSLSSGSLSSSSLPGSLSSSSLPGSLSSSSPPSSPRPASFFPSSPRLSNPLLSNPRPSHE